MQLLTQIQLQLIHLVVSAFFCDEVALLIRKLEEMELLARRLEEMKLLARKKEEINLLARKLEEIKLLASKAYLPKGYAGPHPPSLLQYPQVCWQGTLPSFQ